jgi:aminoglycoside phosphotransferase (APT) family kinase protein
MWAMMQKFRMRAGSVDTHHGRMSEAGIGPVAAGVRVAYDTLPTPVRSWVDATLGSRVVQARTQHGGFSPGVAARLVCADGTRAFVKAVSAETNADSPTLHRREIEVLGLLPPELPVPRLIAAYDETPWVALLIDEADGRQPRLPWDDAQLDRALALARSVNAVTGVPLGSIGERLAEWAGWTKLATGPGPQDPWARRHLDRLIELEQSVADATAGQHLLHVDFRADNVLLGPDRDWLVDWPWARAGAPWVDLVLGAPCIALQGGPSPDDLLRRAGVSADGEAVTAVVAAFAGLMVHSSGQPPPPGIPTVREVQAVQGRIALDWLRARTRW